MWPQRFSLILSAIVSGSVSAGWKLTVSPGVRVSRGEDAVLGCFFTPTRDYSGMIKVTWKFAASNAPPFLDCPVKNDSMHGANPCAFSDLKHSLKGDPRWGDGSLLIRDVQLTDNGAYFCRVELDGWKNFKKAKTELYVGAEPHILNLSVVEMPCGSDSAPRRLQCQAEGNPLPKIAWLSASRRMLENKGESSQSSPYHVTSCVPYLEEEELTCRAEGALNHTERTYRTREAQDQSEESEESEESNSLKISLIVYAVIALLILIAGIVFYCLRRDHPQQVSQSAAHEEEFQAFYSVAATPDSTSSENHRQRVSACPAEREQQMVYSVVTVPEPASLENHHRQVSAGREEELQEVYSEAISISCDLYSPMNIHD
ncbi:sialic acid-binding Ig-like lectin 15 isoform X4 [Simochromis diagramma]|uniref:sialic acid-binding Ig-like lectin 15 isoform X4 n=1 Tax=Simochromis diagramma TaxID=43689 RepID=UPI001A7E2222|nr:sialic acid-binding Ig-like lectin 15 isoform X4 [Simochromis diagramma]